MNLSLLDLETPVLVTPAEPVDDDLLMESNLAHSPYGLKRTKNGELRVMSPAGALTLVEQERYVPLCPDFVLELRSKSDRLAPLQAKMEDWIANGSQLARLVDPARRSVTVYRPGELPEEFYDPTSVQGTGPTRGFELLMGDVWGSGS